MSCGGIEGDALDPDVLESLRDVMDPEIGLSIVDIGLVCRAMRTPHEISVEMTLTTRSCPLGEMIVEEARQVLAMRFPSVPRIHVELVWDRPWNSNLLTERGLEQLGRSPRRTS